jgi:hypothetical protein
MNAALDTALKEQALDHLRELLESHWKTAKDSADDDLKSGGEEWGVHVFVADP